MRGALVVRADTVGELFARGNALLAQQRFADAIGCYDKALEAQPTHVGALHRRGIALLQLRRFPQALASHDRALAISPGDPEGHCVRGNALFALSRCEDALRSYDRALAIQPNYPAALHSRGMVLRNLKRPVEAIASYDAALRIKPDCIETLHNRAIALRDMGRLSEALASHEKALALRPADPLGQYNRAAVLADLGRNEDARAAYEQAIALNRDFAEAYNNRGNLLLGLRRTTEALADYDSAITLRPNFAAAHNNRGNVLFELGRYIEALGSYEQALALCSDYKEARLGRGMIMLQILNRPAEALADFDRALAVSADAETHQHRALTLFALKRFEEALDAYNRALALKPAFAGALKGRGSVLALLQRSEEAAASYRSAREAGADAEEITFLLAGLGASPPPAVAPRKFITDLFDQHARHFDHRLVDQLKYRGPDLIGAAVERVTRGRHTCLDILDIGCGTGLVGERIRSLAGTLTGVDLSSRMLEQAKARRIYDRLVCADLVDFLAVESRTFDLVVAGDVFIYIGDLSSVMREVRRVLRAKGLLAFTVETKQEDAVDFVLRPRLRYAQSLGYLRRLAEHNRFTILDAKPATIRQEEGVDVDGRVLVMCASES